MDLEIIKKLLLDSKELISVIGTIVTIVIALWLFLMGGLKKVWSLFRPNPKQENNGQATELTNAR